MEQLPPSYDMANWAFWSPSYRSVDGEGGVPIASAGVSRYVQLELRLHPALHEAPRLDQLILEFIDTPLARAAVAEAWPLVVDSFEPTTFVYVVKPTLEPGNAGFDQLEILTHVRAHDLLSVSLDGVPVDTTQFQSRIEDDRLVLAFPRLQGAADSEKQLEVVFETRVLRYGTQFDGWISNRERPDEIKQRIRPGNATFRFAGDALGVRTPVGGDLLIEVTATPNPFTPNGDGVNDKLTLSYKLRVVTAVRAVSLVICDLGGSWSGSCRPCPSAVYMLSTGTGAMTRAGWYRRAPTCTASRSRPS